MEEKSNAFLETEPVGKLMAKYAVPCVISLLVAALYNVVDQIFIANATYLGSFGNAANTVVFPMTVVALAIAVLIGDGCCAFVSLSLGGGREEDAHKSIGSAIILCILCSIDVGAKYEIYELMNGLCEEGKCVVMVTSDMEELLGMSDRIVVFGEKCLAGELIKEEFSQERILDMASTSDRENETMGA